MNKLGELTTEILDSNDLNVKKEIENLQKEIHDREVFTSHIHILHQRSYPSPIFVAAFFGVDYWKCIPLPANIWGWSWADVLDLVGNKIIDHYAENRGYSPFGKILGYVFRKTYDIAYQFDTEGNYLAPYTDKIVLGKAYFVDVD